MGIEKERGISVVTSVMTFEYGGLRLQPARHAGPRGLLRGHLPDAHGGRFRRHGDRRREGHRGAHAQALRGLPPARHPDRHLRQQDGPREPRPVRPPRRDREDPGARHRAVRPGRSAAGRSFAGTFDLAPQPRAPHRHRRGADRRSPGPRTTALRGARCRRTRSRPGGTRSRWRRRPASPSTSRRSARGT